MRHSVLLWLILGLTACGTRSQDEVRFSFKYRAGEVYTYRIFDDVESYRSSTGRKEESYIQHQRQRSIMRILDRDSTGLYKIHLSYVVESDSVWKLENGERVLRPRNSNTVGKKYEYTLHMRDDGEIVDIQGRDEGSTFFYERAYKTSQPVFPKNRIAPGYTWRQNVAVSMPGAETFSAITTYTFSGFATIRDTRCAVIDFQSTLEIKTELSRTRWNRRGHQRWNYENITTSTGKIYFDFEDGVMVRKETTMTTRRKSDIVDKDGQPRKDFRRTIDREIIELVCVHQDSLSSVDK